MPRASVPPILLIFVYLTSCLHARSYVPSPDVGRAAGFLPDCPGVLKNATISRKTLRHLLVVSHQLTLKGHISKRFPILNAQRLVAADKNIDLRNKKTVIYCPGYLESSYYPHTQLMAKTYLKKGYNVFVSETFYFLSFMYPKSVRIARAVGRELGAFLAKLTEQGLEPENLELAGISLGGQIIGFIAKEFYRITGKKPSRLTALDPSGPCFRNVPAEYRLNPSDGERVDVIHTNIEGYGNPERLGHIDFYVNGGEYQPGDLIFNACTQVCSHAKSFLYWWQALENPKKFIAILCDTVQDARLANFREDSTINYLGAETDFSKPGIYYLGTNGDFPYYRGEIALKPENEIFSSSAKEYNVDDNLVV
ncbi:phospholipase A1 2-like [Plodia interpunctella]|uniref:phospholipase A1 2-like n=1 Tax=Plodia interpunctella TaxID=58824 RepID=UPI0023681577|nr:phospholipase A1 2-like [Plodia interpunctella]